MNIWLRKTAAMALCATAFAVANPTAQAAPVSEQQARSMAEGWLKAGPNPLSTPLAGRTIGQIQTSRDQQGNALYYVLPLKPEGFILASADTEIEAVIAFGSSGQFQPAKDNPLFALVEQDMRTRLNGVRRQTPATAATRKAAATKWTSLSAPATARPLTTTTSLTNVDDLRVAPFLQSQWNQSSIYVGTSNVACFNYYTPPYAAGASSNYDSGCVSTAWAQIMRYFQYPTQGVGTKSYTIEVNGASQNRALRGGNGAGGPYQWSQMPLVPGNGITLAEREAIGDLTSDIGVVCNADYSPSGTSAGMSTSSLQSVFGFSNVMFQNGFPTNFTNEINPNLDAKLPVCIDVNDSKNDGHSLVCDGYGFNQATAYHHLNLGWGGLSDAWYNLPDIYTSSYDFTIVEDLFYNIFTNGSGEIISGRVLTKDSAPVSGATVTAVEAGGGSYQAATDTNGIFALAKVPSDSQFTITVSASDYVGMTTNVETGISGNGGSGNVWGVDFALAAGSGSGSVKVTISPAAAVSAGAEWQVDGGAWNTNGATVSGLTLGSHTVSFNPVTDWTTPSNQTVSVTANSITTATGTYAQQSGSLTMTIYPAAAVTAGAEWQVDSNAQWHTSGATVTNLSVGAHTVSFSALGGWTSPTNQTVSVTANFTTTASATYIAPGSLQVNISPPGAVSAGALWQVDTNGQWQTSGATVTNLSVGNHTVSFSAVNGWTTPAIQTVSVSPMATTTATGTYTPAGSLQVTISPAGAVTAGVEWDVDGGAWQTSGATVSNLSVGNHTVSFSAANGWSAPASQTVFVSANSTTTATGTSIPPGALQVTINPAGAVAAGALWQVDNNGQWQTNGATIANLLAGNHTVSFKSIAGWTAPANQIVSISANTTTLDTNTYVQLFGSLQVFITPSGALSTGALWQVDGNGQWQTSGATVSNLPVSSHTVSFSTIAGFVTPSNQTVSISANTTDQATGTYVQQFGSLQVTINPPAAIIAGALWQVDNNGQWQTNGATLTNLSLGSHTVSFRSFIGWTAPSNQTVSISFNSTSQAAGTYVQQFGSLQVTLGPAAAITAGALWQMDNSGQWLTNGATLANVPVGGHLLSFATLGGWTTPSDQVVSISSNLTTAASGTYVQQFGSLQVTLGPAAAVKAGALWQVDGNGQWLTNGAKLTNLPAGSHILAFQPVAGWAAPSNQTVAISDGTTAHAAGLYLKGDLKFTVTSPAASQRWSNSTFTAAGAATDNVQVSNVFCQLNGNGWIPAIPSNNIWSNWTATLTPLENSNLFEAYAVDIAGDVSPTNKVHFLYIPSAPLTVSTNGNGKITPVDNGKLLAIGTNYSLTAAPGKNWLFSNWVGGTNLTLSTLSTAPMLSTSSNYTFPMQSNLVLTANFVTNPFLAVAGSYNGLFYPTDGATNVVTEAGSGFISVAIASNSAGAYTAKLLLDGETNSFSGSFNLTGIAQQTNLARKGRTPVSVTLSLDFNPANALISGSVSNEAGWNSVIQANRAVFSATANPATNYAGHFTLLFPPETNAPVESPDGCGYAAVTNTLAGISTLGGALADGTPFLWSVPIAGNGGIPLYQSLYSGKGSLLGWICFTNEPPQNVSANSWVSWIKPSIPKTLYPSGFTNLTGVLGSPYTNTAKSGVPVLNLTNATLLLTNGDLTNNILLYTNIGTNQFSRNTLTNLDAGDTNLSPTNHLLIAINTNNGVVTITFRETGAKTNTVAHGAVLQNQTHAAGYFLGTNQSGSFLLTPQ
jgi:hypothetical protein